MSRVVPRVALAVLGVAAIVFLAIWLGDVRRYEHAVRLGSPASASRADLERALSLSRDSERLRADSAAQLYVAGMLERLGRHEAAIRQAQQVLSAQPDYTVAYFFLAKISAGREPGLYKHAIKGLQTLRPLSR
jgi:tetratricopeptide (TPR) repeat protein